MTVVAHVGLAVSDLERSMQFYTGLFGFAVDRITSFGHGEIDELLRLDRPSDVRVAYLTLGGFTLELLQFMPASAETAGSRVINQTGLTHLALVRGCDIATFEAAADDFGVAISSRSGATLMLRDPDGQLIEVLPPDYPRRFAAGRLGSASAGRASGVGQPIDEGTLLPAT